MGKAPDLGVMLIDDRALEREAMVSTQLQARDIRDPRVLAAMRSVPRHLFAPEQHQNLAYGDHPLPLGPGRTLSQPYIVAFMAQALGLNPTEKVLEVGSGCGYACAVLSGVAGQVFGIELDLQLAEASILRLGQLGYLNIQIQRGDGALGWPEQGPFDAVILSCAAPRLPERLWEQLRPGGRALFPQESGGGRQELVLVHKTAAGPLTSRLLGVAFVPLLSGRGRGHDGGSGL